MSDILHPNYSLCRSNSAPSNLTQMSSAEPLFPSNFQTSTSLSIWSVSSPNSPLPVDSPLPDDEDPIQVPLPVQVPSFWETVGCVDVVKDHLWPFLNDMEFLNVTHTSKSAVAYKNNYPAKEAVSVDNFSKMHEKKRNLVSFDKVIIEGITDLRKLNELDIDGSLLPTKLYFKKCFNNFLVTRNYYPSLIPQNPPDHSLFYGTIRLIKFGHEFNRVIHPGILPESLLELEFGYSYDKSIMPGVLPQSLRSLKFNGVFDKKIGKGVLPHSLIELVFGNKFNQFIDLEILPSNLEALTLGNFFNRRIDLGTFPDSLKTLVFGYFFAQHSQLIEALPLGLTKFNFGYEFNEVLSGRLRDLKNLKSLGFSYKYNQPIGEHVFPDSLTQITFGYKFNQVLAKNSLPPNLQYLEFGDCFNQEIDFEVLPKTLLSLIFGRSFNQKIKKGVLPRGLTYLRLNSTEYKIIQLEY